MKDTPQTAPAPEESNVVLKKLELSDEQLARAIQRILLKEAMRRQPKPPSTLTISFGDEPDFFIVDEPGKG